MQSVAGLGQVVSISFLTFDFLTRANENSAQIKPFTRCLFVY